MRKIIFKFTLKLSKSFDLNEFTILFVESKIKILIESKKYFQKSKFFLASYLLQQTLISK